MAISGAVDITDDHEPSITVTSTGTVLLDLDGVVFARFRTVQHFDRVMEHLDRQRVAFGDQQSLDGYHERFQALCAERGELAAPPLRAPRGDDAA
jgi:hypothetical protein